MIVSLVAGSLQWQGAITRLKVQLTVYHVHSRRSCKTRNTIPCSLWRVCIFLFFRLELYAREWRSEGQKLHLAFPNDMVVIGKLWTMLYTPQPVWSYQPFQEQIKWTAERQAIRSFCDVCSGLQGWFRRVSRWRVITTYAVHGSSKFGVCRWNLTMQCYLSRTQILIKKIKVGPFHAELTVSYIFQIYLESWIVRISRWLQGWNLIFMYF